MTDIAQKNDRRTILLGLTGGIAAYKAAELVRRLGERGIAVHVAMTKAACGFITPATLQALSGHPVYTDMWDGRVANGMPHIELSRDKQAIVIAPATADFMAKAALGLADDLLSTLCLARDCPLIIAPAMNRQMWEHPATQRNVAQLKRDGVIILGPDSGDQACGETGDGRMLEPEEILDALRANGLVRAGEFGGPDQAQPAAKRNDRGVHRLVDDGHARGRVGEVRCVERQRIAFRRTNRQAEPEAAGETGTGDAGGQDDVAGDEFAAV